MRKVILHLAAALMSRTHEGSLSAGTTAKEVASNTHTYTYTYLYNMAGQSATNRVFVPSHTDKSAPIPNGRGICKLLHDSAKRTKLRRAPLSLDRGVVWVQREEGDDDDEQNVSNCSIFFGQKGEK